MARAPLSPYRALLRAGMRRVWAVLRALRQTLRELRSRLPAPVKRAIRRISRITAGTVVWIVAAIAAVFVVAHFWLPTVAEKKTDIERYLSGAIGNPVELGGLQTFWDGLNPGLRVQDLRILTVAGEPALRLRAAQLSLSWRALLFGNVEINNLTLVGPQLTVERTLAGKLRVTGLAPQAATPAALPDFSEWLLRQHSIAIVDGELEWVDRAAPAGRDMVEHMTIRSAQISLRNDGARHEFSLRAVFPEAVCTACQVSGYIQGNPLLENDWSGELRVQGQQLGLQHLPGVVRQRLPAGLSGTVSVSVLGRWRAARLEDVSGRMRVQDFSVPVGERGDVLTLRQVETVLRWRGEPKRWRLELEPLRLAHSAPVWQAGRLEIEARGDEGQLRIEHVNLNEVAGFLAGWSAAAAIKPWLEEARPGGWLHQLRWSWSGSPLAPASYQLEAQADGLHAEPSGKVPGLTGLSGQLQLTPGEGEFRIDSHAGRLDLPRVMHESISFSRLASRVRWRRDPADWWVQAGDIELRNNDARVDGDVELRFPFDRQQSPIMKLTMALHDGRGESVDRYFPRVTPEKLRTYLSQAIHGGRVTRATVVAQGAIRNFPFRDGKGKFEVRAAVKGGQLEFLPGWPALRNLDVDMRFTGAGMLLTASSGGLRNLHVSRVAVEIEDFRAPQGAVLTVRGHASGAVDEALTVIQESKLPRLQAWLIPGVRVAGQGALDLDLRIPLSAIPSLLLEGEYRVAGGRLQHAALPQPVEGVRGMLGFDLSGLRTGQLQARWLGSPLQLEASRAARAGVNMAMRGAIAANDLSELLGPALAGQVRGSVPWQLQWLTGADRNWLTLGADFKDVEINLPAPFEKPRGEPLQLEARSNGIDGNSLLIDLQAGNRLAGKLAWRKSDGRWSFQRGRLAAGERTVPLPTQDGLHLSARLPELNVDRWWPVLQPALSLSGSGSEAALVNRVSLDVATLYFLDRTFGRLSLDVARGAGFWSGQLDGESVAGKGKVSLPAAGDAAARASLELNLERLAVPLASPGARAGSLDPRKLPAVQIRSDSFRYAQYDLGALDFRAEPVFAGWRIAALKLARPETELQASGQWSINRLGKQSSRFDVVLHSSNLGETLNAFGYGEELAGGKLILQSSWNWAGPPGDFALADLNGEANVTLKDGRLPRVSPGAGRLFGAFDLRSVTRILTLDLSSLFAKGLSFDSLHGKLEVDNGNAYTRSLAIQAPGADIDLRGRIGLAARDLDMEMDVTPRVSTNLAPVIGGTILGGPVVGGAIAVLGGVTRKPFEKSTRVEYLVKGPWNDPKVEQVRKPAPAGEDARPE